MQLWNKGSKMYAHEGGGGGVREGGRGLKK